MCDAAGGTRRTRPLFQNSEGDVPLESQFLKFFKIIYQVFFIFPDFQNEVTEIRGEIRICG